MALAVAVATSIVSVASAEAQEINPRDLLSGEFKGTETTFVYKDESGKIIIEPYVTKLGRLQRGIDAVPFTSSTTANLHLIPSAGLAAEHWWLSFELTIMAQKDFAECVVLQNEYRHYKGQCAIDDIFCDYMQAVYIQTVRDYWVPHNIHFDRGVPTKEIYIAHIEAGIDSLNIALAARDACRQTLQQLREEHAAYLLLLQRTIAAQALSKKKKKRK